MEVAFKSINCDEEWSWFYNLNNVTMLPDMTSILAYNVETKEPLACCIMDTWTETSCQVHFAIENPMVLRHGFFEEITKFVYDTSDRLIMYGLVPSDNKKALSVDKKIGFREITRLKDAFKRGVDYVLLEMRSEDCNFYITEDREHG
jgi:hypothetical protein